MVLEWRLNTFVQFALVANANRIANRTDDHKDLHLLIDYKCWARDHVLDPLAAITPEQFTCPTGNSFTSVGDTLAHICAAEHIWIARLKGEEPQELRKPDRFPDVGAARKEWTELEDEVCE